MASFGMGYTASASTTSTITVPIGTNQIIPSWDCFWYNLTELIDEDDWEYQYKQRKLRYGPFHIKKTKLVKSVYHHTKPLIQRQTILQPFRINKI